MITVITHNGKPPSEGGIRSGYSWSDPEHGTGGRITWGKMPTLPSVKRVGLDARPLLVVLGLLDNHCNEVYCKPCNRFTWLGRKQVRAGEEVRCEHCGVTMTTTLDIAEFYSRR
jgi:hypothetical protein